MSTMPIDGFIHGGKEVSFSLNPDEGLWSESFANPLAGIAILAVVEHDPEIHSRQPTSDALGHLEQMLNTYVDGPYKTVEEHALVLRQLAQTVADYRYDTYPGLKGLAIAGIFEDSVGLAYAGTGAVAVARSGRRTKLFNRTKPHENFRMNVAKSPHTVPLRETGTVVTVSTKRELAGRHIPDTTLGAVITAQNIKGAYMLIEKLEN